MTRLFLFLTLFCLVNCSPAKHNADNEAQNRLRAILIETTEEYLQSDKQNASLPELIIMAGREDILHASKTIASHTYSSHYEELPYCVPISEDIIETIIKEANTHSLLIINHNSGSTRELAFIFELIKALDSIGYTHYTSDLFFDDIERHNLSHSSVLEGFHTNDPIFGRILDFTKTKGFKHTSLKLSPEQEPSQDVDVSEWFNTTSLALRDNFLEASSGKKLKSKVIMLTEFPFIGETRPYGENAGSITPMPYILKTEDGISPLTISQTVCKSPQKIPVLATSYEGYEEDPDELASTDFHIGYPPLTFTKSRPDWRREIGDIDTPVPAAFLGHSEAIIIEARRPEEPDLAVPIERLLLLPGETDIPLLLPPGTYRVDAFTKAGRFGEAITLTVPAP